MKQKLFNILVVLALLILSANTLQPAYASGLLQEIKAAVAPTTISYQGIVKVDGVPFNGTGYFKFAILSGSTSHWSNDGTSTGGGAPTSPVPLPVSDGLFSVRLGDTSLSGMTRIINGQIMYQAGSNSVLRVWFSPDGVAAYTQLTPDRAFSSAPFALVSEYAVEASSLDGYTASDFQQRVSGACAPGNTVQSVNADGSVNCLPFQPKLGYEINTVDGITVAAGEYASMAIGEDGLPVISYYSDFSLKVAHCEDPACNAATISTVDDTTTVGLDTSITIGSDGLPVISYQDYINKNLKFARCTSYDCSTSTKRALDSAGDVGYNTSITIGGDGYPVISYRDSANSDLKLMHCNSLDCSAYGGVIVDNGSVSNETSITTTIDGLPIISYQENNTLKVAYCQDYACTAPLKYTVDSSSGSGRYSSITIGSDNYPIISYHDTSVTSLKLAHCTNKICSASTTTELFNWNDTGKHNSIAIGSDGLPIIVFNIRVAATNTGYLFVIHCSDVACAVSNDLELVNELINTGLYTSIAIGTDGLPIISYYSDDSDTLKVLHCANTLCSFYRRGR